MPRASVRSATVVKPGALVSVRRASRRSASMGGSVGGTSAAGSTAGHLGAKEVACHHADSRDATESLAAQRVGGERPAPREAVVRARGKAVSGCGQVLRIVRRK